MKHVGGYQAANSNIVANGELSATDAPELLSNLVIKLGQIQSLITGQPYFRRAFAGKIYAIRRIRSRFFPEDLFAEPAWDILLLLYSVEKSQDLLSVSAVCSRVDAPATTVLRWIEKLEKVGMLMRRKHPTDRHVTHLQLSEECISRLDQFFDSALTIEIGPCRR
jgi:DNA-binding MarR family transcriptional regulator